MRNLTVSVAFNSEIDTFSHFKKVQTFSENLFIFYKKAKIFWIFWENCLIQLRSTAKLIPSVISKWIHFFGESLYFFRTAKSLNILRNVSVSVEFYCKSATASQFLQLQDFCSKNPFFFKKAWSLNFLRTVTISVDSTASLLPLPFKKTSVFPGKTKYSLILLTPKNWTFWETSLILSHCTANLLPSEIFQNFKVFFGKPTFFAKNTAFEHFEKSHCSVRIQHQIG